MIGRSGTIARSGSRRTSGARYADRARVRSLCRCTRYHARRARHRTNGGRRDGTGALRVDRRSRRGSRDYGNRDYRGEQGIFVVLLIIASMDRHRFVQRESNYRFFFCRAHRNNRIRIATRVNRSHGNVSAIPTCRLSIFSKECRFYRLPRKGLHATRCQGRFIFRVKRANAVYPLTFRYRKSIVVTFPRANRLCAITVTRNRHTFRLRVLCTRAEDLVFFRRRFNQDLQFARINLYRPCFQRLTRRTRMFPNRNFR